jgi:predicted Zn-dependent protease
MGGRHNLAETRESEEKGSMIRRTFILLTLLSTLGAGSANAETMVGNAGGYSLVLYPQTTLAARVEQVTVNSNPSSAAAQILQRIKKQNKVPASLGASIRVIPSQQLNAYTNGQTIVLTDKLWNTLKTDDQRAFVIAHELGHIMAKHIQQTQYRRVGLVVLDQYVLDRYLPQSGLWNIMTNVGLNLADKYSSRNLEYQADDIGFQLMRRAGYRPRAAIEVLRTLERLQKNGTPGFLMDHPTDKARIQRLVEKYEIGK